MSEDRLTGMYDVLDALEAVIKAAPKAQREALAAAVDAYAENFPDEFFWATGGQAPALLQHLMMLIATDDEGQEHARNVRLVAGKPKGNA